MVFVVHSIKGLSKCAVLPYISSSPKFAIMSFATHICLSVMSYAVRTAAYVNMEMKASFSCVSFISIYRLLLAIHICYKNGDIPSLCV